MLSEKILAIIEIGDIGNNIYRLLNGELQHVTNLYSSIKILILNLKL